MTEDSRTSTEIKASLLAYIAGTDWKESIKADAEHMTDMAAAENDVQWLLSMERWLPSGFDPYAIYFVVEVLRDAGVKDISGTITADHILVYKRLDQVLTDSGGTEEVGYDSNGDDAFISVLKAALLGIEHGHLIASIVEQRGFLEVPHIRSLLEGMEAAHSSLAEGVL